MFAACTPEFELAARAISNCTTGEELVTVVVRLCTCALMMLSIEPGRSKA